MTLNPGGSFPQARRRYQRQRRQQFSVSPLQTSYTPPESGRFSYVKLSDQHRIYGESAATRQSVREAARDARGAEHDMRLGIRELAREALTEARAARKEIRLSRDAARRKARIVQDAARRRAQHAADERLYREERAKAHATASAHAKATIRADRARRAAKAAKALKAR